MADVFNYLVAAAAFGAVLGVIFFSLRHTTTKELTQSQERLINALKDEREQDRREFDRQFADIRSEHALQEAACRERIATLEGQVSVLQSDWAANTARGIVEALPAAVEWFTQGRK